MSTFNIAIFFLWLASAGIDYADFTHLWQLKEYRLDRFRDFLRSRQGLMFWRRYELLYRSLAALVIFFWPINEIVFVKYAVVIFFAADVLRGAYKARRKTLRRPRLTAKAALIMAFSLILEGGLFVLTRDWSVLFLLLVVRFVLVSAVVLALAVPSRIAKKYYVALARKKLARYPELSVVGITGSYGKTTTKDFLAHILEGKFSVVKTPKNVNTEIGIAKFILSQDFSGVRVFVAEMGAYRKGEIALICKMVSPRMGILTAINEQHLSLFGSMENIKSAKFELLHALPKDGLAIVNSDNPFCKEFLRRLSCDTAAFGSANGSTTQIFIVDTRQLPAGISFRARISFAGVQTEEEFILPVLGIHNAMNAAPCIVAALSFGMTLDEIKKRLASAALPDGTMQLSTRRKALCIDDSYNSNPRGFSSALAVLSGFSKDKRKIVITRGMLELGDRSRELHRKIGKEIAESADELIIISPDSADELESGAGGRIAVARIFDEGKLASRLLELSAEDCVILLENRIPKRAYDVLNVL